MFYRICVKYEEQPNFYLRSDALLLLNSIFQKDDTTRECYYITSYNTKPYIFEVNPNNTERGKSAKRELKRQEYILIHTFKYTTRLNL